jgi:hypothetical protein
MVLHQIPVIAGPSSDVPVVAAEILSERGIMTGDPDGMMRWDEQLTRAEAVKVLLAGLRRHPAGATKPSEKFSDVGSDHWVAKWMSQAAGIGLVRGYSDGMFRPDQPISMAEYAVLLSRVYAILGGHPSRIAVVRVRPDWAADEVGAAEPVLRWLAIGQAAPVDLDFPVTRAQAGNLLWAALQEFGLAYDIIGTLVSVDSRERAIEIEANSRILRLAVDADCVVLLRGSPSGLSEVALGAPCRVVLAPSGLCSLLVIE